MDILHHNLETIKTFGFGILYLRQKIDSQVFVYNTVACRKKCQYVRDKMAFSVLQIGPVSQVLGEVDFLCSPKRSHVNFIKLPNVPVLDWEKNKTALIFL